MERITVAVADLIPGDTLIPTGYVVNGYPYGKAPLSGTRLPLNEDGIWIERYYYNPETPVQILR